MAGGGKRDDQLQDMWTRVDGVAANTQTIHIQLDSMTTSLNECFDRIELAQTSTQTTFDVVVARLNALHTTTRGCRRTAVVVATVCYTVVWTSLGPLPRWVPGPTTRWAPGTTRFVPHGT
jgi:hypothetical protein